MAHNCGQNPRPIPAGYHFEMRARARALIDSRVRRAKIGGKNTTGGPPFPEDRLVSRQELAAQVIRFCACAPFFGEMHRHAKTQERYAQNGLITTTDAL